MDIIELNDKALTAFCHISVPYMPAGSHIINLASNSSWQPVHDNTIKYYDRFYTAEQVIVQAMKDLRKKKAVSILGFPVRMQVRAIKFLPVSLVMKIWCRQQGK